MICVPINQSQAAVVFCANHFKTIHHVNKHEIVFHNLNRLEIIHIANNQN